MDGNSESIGSAMWLASSLSPTYQQLSPGTPGECEQAIGQHQTPLIHQDEQGLIWEDKRVSPRASPEQHPHHQHLQQQQQELQQHHHHHHHQYQQQRGNPLYPDSSLNPSSQSPEPKLCVSSTNLRSSTPSQALKRSAGNLYQLQQSNEPEKKLARKHRSNSSQGWSLQVEEIAEHLVTDFDGSLSVLAASDLATAVASYNMSEALLALPSLTVFKQEAHSPENQHTNVNNLNNNVVQRSINVNLSNNRNAGLAEADSNSNPQNQANLQHHQLLYSNPANDEYPSTTGNHVSSSQPSTEFNEDCRFQYVLAAATSIATKINEETLTYLNQSQSYEIKMKKLGDLAAFKGKLLESTVRICFHERRLQYTEREQIVAWMRARPGERLLEVDIPLSYGILDVGQSSSLNNSIEFTWDPTKEVGCYIKINCISTEFTAKKHGGEKGVPFRIQVETRLAGGPRLHAASCQVKVFKLKGADRKHKQDRDKIRRRPPHEQEKYQPSYDCTVLSDIPLDSLSSLNSVVQNVGSPYSSSDVISPQSRFSESCSPVATPFGLSSTMNFVPAANARNSTVDEPVSDERLETDSSTPSPPAPQHHLTQLEIELQPLLPNASAAETRAWMRAHRFHPFESVFSSYSAADILRMTHDDLIRICGLPEGIRMYNAVHSKPLIPNLVVHLTLETTAPDYLWRTLHIFKVNLATFSSKLLELVGLDGDRLDHIILLGDGPSRGMRILVTDNVVCYMKNDSRFLVGIQNDPSTGRFKLILKPVTISE